MTLTKTIYHGSFCGRHNCLFMTVSEGRGGGMGEKEHNVFDFYCEGRELCVSMKVPEETERWDLTSVGCSLIGFFSVAENWSHGSARWEAKTKLLLSGSASCQDTIQNWLIESSGKPACRTTQRTRTERCTATAKFDSVWATGKLDLPTFLSSYNMLNYMLFCENTIHSSQWSIWSEERL